MTSSITSVGPYVPPPVTPTPTCIELPACTDILRVFFPGGISMDAGPTDSVPECGDLAQNLLNQVNVALLPLVPIFDIVQVLVDLIAVVEALGPPPDPTKLGKALSKLAEDASKLANLLPILSVPVMIKSTLLLIVALLKNIVLELSNLTLFEADITASADLVFALASQPDGKNASVQLDIAVGCAKASLTSQLVGLQQRMSPLKQLICLLNSIAALAPGLPTIPCDFTALDAQEISVNVDILNKAIALLEQLANDIPVVVPDGACSC